MGKKLQNNCRLEKEYHKGIKNTFLEILPHWQVGLVGKHHVSLTNVSIIAPPSTGTKHQESYAANQGFIQSTTISNITDCANRITGVSASKKVVTLTHY